MHTTTAARFGATTAPDTFVGRLNTDRHELALRVFMAIVLAHWLEHLLQVTQIYALGWPVPEGRMLLNDLTEHATQRKFVYRHHWKVGDPVIWDNRCTMHRGRAYDMNGAIRDLRRITTQDVASTLEQ